MIEVLATKGWVAVATVAALSGCAAMNRTRPEDMTVPEHEHAAQIDLRKSEEASTAAAAGGRGADFQRDSMRRHRELAGDHAAATVARRREVAAACAEADDSKTIAAMKVAEVEPIREKPRGSARSYYRERLKGARIAIPVEDGAAQVAAVRSLECEAARAAARVEPVDLASPFAVRTAKAVVRAENPGIVVEVRGDGGEAAVEILRRAKALVQVTPKSTL